MNIKAYISEFLGVMALCFIGIAAIASNGGDNGLIGIALAHGLAIGLSITALGAISGGHFNPAVTLGLFAIGKVKAADVVPYIISQLLGGLAGAALAMVVFGADAVANGTPVVGTGVSVGAAIAAEAVTTFLLVSVICGSAVFGNSAIAGLAIGLTIVMDILAVGPVSGAAMNPARALGPAILGGQWASHWVYWVGPIAGGVLAAVLYDYLYSKKSDA